jgi:hypothetical protein
VASQQLAALIHANYHGNLTLEELVVLAVKATDLLLDELGRVPCNTKLTAGNKF